jgi:predicted Rossmann-fold nucleotide-binding protein
VPSARPDAAFGAGYKTAKEFSRGIAERGYMVITGGGDGIMRACQEGAGRERSFGANIRLPFEQEANEFISKDPKLVTFRYFFTRKLIFVKEADAVALFPAASAPTTRVSRCMTLVQTGKSRPMPIVFVDSRAGRSGRRGSATSTTTCSETLISQDDLSLFKVTDSVEAAIEEIDGFYRTYHSSRFVGPDFVIRLTHPISPELVQKAQPGVHRPAGRRRDRGNTGAAARAGAGAGARCALTPRLPDRPGSGPGVSGS